VIKQRFPEHLAEFVFSVNTGMRLSEQYSCMWAYVDLNRRAIDLLKTKNYASRTVHLNPDALDVIKSMQKPGQKLTDRVFPREKKEEQKQDLFDTRSWFQPCMEDAGITGYVWHSNRHTFCSWLAMAEQPSKRFRSWQATRQSPCRPGTRTCRQTPSWL
jgi:site-specific recombinase XerD